MPLRGLGLPSESAERRQLTRRLWERFRGPLALLGLAVLVFPVLWVPGIAWWLDYSDAVSKADFLVVLGGDLARPHAAAELFKTGVASEVWVARTWRPWGETEAIRLGVPLVPEEELDRDILVKRGVPPEAIHLYGDAVVSTVAEALAFRDAAHPAGKKVLVLTSKYHARRAKMIWRSVIPDASLSVVGTADPDFTRRWWRSQPMAYAAVTETAKLFYWLAGGRFLTARR